MLLTAFALVALLLAAVGVYGLISYSVVQRTREIGIRVALGAQPRQVLGQIMREGLLLALPASGSGFSARSLAARVLSTFLFGVGAADPLTFGAVALLLLAVAWPGDLRAVTPGAAASIRSARCGGTDHPRLRIREGTKATDSHTKARSARRRTKAVTLKRLRA